MEVRQIDILNAYIEDDVVCIEHTVDFTHDEMKQLDVQNLYHIVEGLLPKIEKELKLMKIEQDEYLREAKMDIKTLLD